MLEGSLVRLKYRFSECLQALVLTGRFIWNIPASLPQMPEFVQD